MFRGKEFSNRIELSWLVQELLNFGVLGSLWLWGGARWVGGIWGHLEAWGVSPHACTCMHAHVYMYRNCKWPLTWRHPCLACLSCLTCMCMCACMCVYACVHGTLRHIHIHPQLIHPLATPWGNSWNHLKFNNTWTNQDISIPFKDLKSVKNYAPLGGCMVWWVGGWVGWWVGQVKTLKKILMLTESR